MKNLITVIFIVVGTMLPHAYSNAGSPVEVDSAAKLARVEAELKQVKTELELAKVKLQLKDKEIELLKQKFSDQLKRLSLNSRSRYTSSKQVAGSNNSNWAARQAVLQATQKKEQALKNARLLKYYESERTELYEKIKVAEKDLKNANETIGKEERTSRIYGAKRTLKILYAKRDSLNSTIKKLKYKIY
jgi:chromosome segregation ATPase